MNAYNHLRTHMRKYEGVYAFLVACCIHVFSFDVVRRCECIDITELHLIFVKICHLFWSLFNGYKHDRCYSNQPTSVAPRSGATRGLVTLRLERRLCSVLFTPNLQI